MIFVELYHILIFIVLILKGHIIAASVSFQPLEWILKGEKKADLIVTTL